MASRKSLENIRREWERFVRTGDCDEGVVRKEILDSWKRCRAFGIDPDGGVCEQVLEGDDLAGLLEDNKELIELAKPVLNGLYSFLKGSGFYIILANADICLLDFFGDQTMEKEAARIKYMKGACWKEEYVGTTALGIMPHALAPLQMAGPEHYCRMSQAFTCSAAPIIGESGEFLGLVNVSGPQSDVHKHTLGMVVAATEAIQHSRVILQKNRQLLSVNKYMTNILKTVSEAIIVYDAKKRIKLINSAAAEILGADVKEGDRIDSVVKVNKEQNIFSKFEYHDVECTLLAKDGKKACLVSGVPIIENQFVTGTVAVIRPIETVHNLVKKYGNTQARIQLEDIVGECAKIKRIIEVARQAATTDGNVLLQGESGTGKEVFAQSIHNLSRRRDGPFVAVNCGAIPRDLVGSELFGYTEGAFTGAARGGRPGKFELASRGTIFFDEIADMPREQQVNLLRVLQERRIIRIGGSEEIPVDVRVICASNKSLKEEMERGNFREDLFYRLNVISIEIPPLRERKDDIERLFRHFVLTMGKNADYGVKEIDPEIFPHLQRYSWPGNVRELQNLTERMLSFCLTDTLTVADLPEEVVYALANGSDGTPPNALPGEKAGSVSLDKIRVQTKRRNESAERRDIERALLEHNGNVSKAAQALGLSRNTLYRKMKSYGMGN